MQYTGLPDASELSKLSAFDLKTNSIFSLRLASQNKKLFFPDNLKYNGKILFK